MPLIPPPPEMLQLMLVQAAPGALDRYEVFAEKRFPFLDGSVELRVIGASSIVQVRAAGVDLAEVIACGERPEGKVLAEVALSLLPARSDGLWNEGQVIHENLQVRYSAYLRGHVLWPSKDSPQYLPHRLDYRFPGEHEPLTVIEAGEVSPGKLSVSTWHEYPEFGTALGSITMWDFRQ
jgi:hypothetical protein